jgi:hypothetical protein
VCFALTFFAGGTSETFAAAQVTALVVAALAAASLGRRRLLALVAAGLLGAGLALVIVAVSPGNGVRQETVSRIPLSMALPQAIEFTWGWLRLTFARPHAVVLLLLVAIPAAVAAGAPRVARCALRVPRWWVLCLGALATALVILACMLPAFYALGSNPPGRAQVIPQYVLVCGLAVLGWLVGAAAATRINQVVTGPLPSAAVWCGLLALLVLGPLVTAGEAFQRVASARAYAAAWDNLDRDVRAERRAGVQNVSVPGLASTGNVQNLEFVGSNPHDWFNECVARYYGVSTIASTLGVP